MRPGVEQVLKGRAAARQGFEVEAERGELVGQGFEFGLAGGAVVVAEGGDAGCRIAHEGERLAFAQHVQRTGDLLQRFVQPLQGLAPRRIAEEVVKCLFDLGEAGEHLLRQLLEEGLVLCRGGAGVGGSVRFGGQGFAAPQGLQALQHGLDPGTETGCRRATLEAGLEQQQRGRDFHRGRIREQQRVAAQPAGEIEHARHQGLRRRAAERCRRRFHRRDRVLETRERHRGAGAEVIPVRARARQLAVEGVEQRGAGRAADRRPGFGQQGVELPAFAHRALLFGGDRAVRDLVQQLAQQAVGRRGRARQQAAELGVDLGAEALDPGLRLQAAVDQRIVEGQTRPPQAACRGVVLLRLDLGDRLAHRVRAVAVRALAQPLQQTALEAAARAAQGQHGSLGRRRPGAGVTRGWPARQVGGEQVDRTGVGLAARGRQRHVRFGEAQGLVGRAVGELFQVVADHRQRAPDQRARGGVGGDRLAGHLAEQLLERVGELGQAVEADDGQRAAHLVHMGTGELQARGGGVGAALVEDLAGALECGVDLALDPGQRPQVGRGGVCHAGRSRRRRLRP